MKAPIGIFGGTFDPIHFGHLRTGFELSQRLQLHELRWIPSGRPGHRDAPLASPAMRLAMVRAAIEGQSGFVADDREVKRERTTFTIDTLEELRGEFPEHPLCLILGMDAFLGLPKWHRAMELLSFCHIVVAHRPGWSLPATGPLAELVAASGVSEVAPLHTALSGRVYVHAVTQLEIASSELRAILISGGDPRFLVPEPVRRIILETGCYARR
ncbi:MAG: nicotinate-nucleotide adenylyltransferase [Acidibacter sp.]|jgi:nicotinate-nucleotide adenylyltransferase|nr:nicotinate-nucleotide adenylyltransferase [Acidibacter sp.]